MTYKRFEELPVWQSAQDFSLGIYQFTEHPAVRRVEIDGGDLGDQLRRASLSISNNIAEGFERGTTPDMLKFLYIARGSAGECRSMLRFAARLPQLAEVRQQIAEWIPLAESCSRQLQKWMDSLQNSDMKGQRHVNDEVREIDARQKRSEAFREKLRAMNAHLNPKESEA